MKNKNKICLSLILLIALSGCFKINNQTSNDSSSTNKVSETSTTSSKEGLSSSSSKVSSSTTSNLSSSSSSSSNPKVSSSTNSSSSSSSSKNPVTPTNPTITVVDDFRININEHVNYLSLVNAVDTIDGNITHLVTVDLPANVEMINGDLYFGYVGTYNIVFNVKNSSGLSSSADVNIEVYKIENKDFTGPTILGYKNIRVKENVMAYPLEGVTAIDDIDGDVTSLLSATYETDGDATNGISFDKEGLYTVVIKAKDLSDNYSQVLVTIEVNNEDLPTAVDITDLLVKEYNCNIGDSNVVPFEGAKSKIIQLKHNSESVKYANAKFVFTPTEDLDNKKLSFYVKLGDNNVTKNSLGLYLMNNGEKLASLTFQVSATSNEGYSVVDKGDGWYLFTVAFSKQWPSLDSYVVDSIRLSYSNIDVTKTATVYIANALLDFYKEGDIDVDDNPSGGDNGGGNGGQSPLPTSDLSDKIISNGNSTVTIDTTVSHDGVQSAKIKGANASVSQYTQALYNFETPISTDNLNISFYIKLDGSTVYSNRIAFRVCTTNDDKIDPQIYLHGSSNPTGVSIDSADENGWYKITINCNELEYDSKKVPAGETLKYVRFTFEAADKKEETKVIEPVIWVDELSYNYGESNEEKPSTPEVPSVDLSDKITHSSNSTINLDTEVNHDGVQSAKITGSPATSREDYSLAFYYGSATLTAETTISFYAKLGDNIYSDRIAFRIMTKEGAKVTNNISITKTNPISGVTCTPDANGWYHIVVSVAEFTDINNSTLTAVGGTLDYLRFGIIATDRGDATPTIVPVAWIDELIITSEVL